MRTKLLYFCIVICIISGCSSQKDEKPPAVKDRPLRIVTFGDSITLGIWHGVKPDETFTYYFGKYLSAKGLKVEMIRKGVSGETTPRARKRMEWDVLPLEPDYCLIMYGTNDAFVDIHVDENDKTPRVPLKEYKKNLRHMVRKLKENNIKPVLMTPIPMGNHKYLQTGIYKGKAPNFLLAKYAAAVREITRDENIPLVDHFNTWLKWKKQGTDIETLLTDSIHPNQPGHLKIAKTIVRQLTKHIKYRRPQD